MSDIIDDFVYADKIFRDLGVNTSLRANRIKIYDFISRFYTAGVYDPLEDPSKFPEIGEAYIEGGIYHITISPRNSSSP